LRGGFSPAREQKAHHKVHEVFGEDPANSGRRIGKPLPKKATLQECANGGIKSFCSIESLMRVGSDSAEKK